MALGSTHREAPRFEMRTRGVVKWAKLAPILAHVLKKLGVKVIVDGMDISEHGDALRLKSLAADAASSFPFQCTTIEGGVNVRHGNYGGIALSDTVVSPPSSGNGSIYFEITFTVVTNEAGTKVLGGTVTDVTIASGSALPSDSDLTKYLEICPTVDGAPMGNSIRYSLDYKICDDGSGEGIGELKHGIAG